MLRKIIVLEKRDYLSAAWKSRSFAPAGLELTDLVQVRGQNFIESMYPVPAFRRLQPGVESAAAPIGSPAKPAAIPHDTYVMAGMFDDEEAVERFRSDRSEEVVGIFADPKIEATPVYCQNGPVGSTNDVVRALELAKSKRKLTGRGVRVAIVDTGIDGNHLGPNGRTLSGRIDPKHGYPSGYTPGSAPRDHGTMVAYDVSIAAPLATLYDYALLRTGAGTWQGFLSDAIAVYADLIDLLQHAPGPLVVNNSWGLFDRSDDAPIGSPENYSANANHPFNQIVGALLSAGADVIFAAGNCGADCPDGRCGVSDVGPGASIHGANSHPGVITVAAVTVKRDRLGYSSQGPGDLSDKKPDIAGYSHFSGSGVYAADGGTSAAAPVVAGVVAMLRQQLKTQTAAEMKGIVQKSAQSLDGGWNYNTGYGVITTRGAAMPAAKAPRRRVGAKKAASPSWMHVPTPSGQPVIVSETANRKKATSSKQRKTSSRRKRSGRKTATSGSTGKSTTK